MGGVHPVPIPYDADSNVGELGVHDVRVVRRRLDEGFHDGSDVGTGPDVLPELGPGVGDASTDRTRMADEGSFAAHAVSHRSSPASGEVRELDIGLKSGKTDGGSCCIDPRDERALVGN